MRGDCKDVFRACGPSGGNGKKKKRPLPADCRNLQTGLQPSTIQCDPGEFPISDCVVIKSNPGMPGSRFQPGPDKKIAKSKAVPPANLRDSFFSPHSFRTSLMTRRAALDGPKRCQVIPWPRPLARGYGGGPEEQK